MIIMIVFYYQIVNKYTLNLEYFYVVKIFYIPIKLFKIFPEMPS